MKILFVTKDLSDNSLGRTYALWLCAKELGWQTRVVSIRGQEIWSPLQNSDFAASCTIVDAHGMREACAEADLVVAVKPLTETLGQLTRVATPLLVDIDDPDLEGALSVDQPARRAAKLLFKSGNYRTNSALRRLARRLPSIVSNPELQRIYGGQIVPHARVAREVGAQHLSDRPSIVFVGTNRPHKGIDTLRRAVEKLSTRGFTLTVTDTAPSDAKPWEEWVGRTSLEEGLDIVSKGDISVIPSSARDSYAQRQLPAKLIDGMMAARAVVGSDVPPIRWALGDAGVLVRPDSPEDLSHALLSLAAPASRRSLGEKARNRALSHFEVRVVSRVFKRACEEALASQVPRTRIPRSEAYG